MTVINVRSFPTIVSNIAAGMQGRVSIFLNFVIGSTLRAIAEAHAGVDLWMQGIALKILKKTRLATSYGVDVDSFLADYGITKRLGAQASTGLVTYSRYSPSETSPVVPVGSLVQTSNAKIVFAVVADSTNPLYSKSLGGYVMPAQVTQMQVPVQAIVPGSTGNIAQGSISQISSSVLGLDTVTNDEPFTNGIDFEQDDAVKDRFRLDITGLSKGTTEAIKASVADLRQGLTCEVMNGVDLDGTIDHGMVSIIVDDGTGNISDDMFALAQTAIIAVLADGVRWGIYKAKKIDADVTATVAIINGYVRQDVIADVVAAIELMINGLGQNVDLPFYDVSTTIREVAGVQKLVSLSLNGQFGVDLQSSPTGTIKTRNVIVS